MYKFMLLVLIFSSTFASHAGEILVATLAQVKGHVITSRELALHEQVEKVLGVRQEDQDRLSALDRLVREWLLFLEAKAFYETPVDSNQLSAESEKVVQAVGKERDYKKWGFSKEDLRSKLRRRLEADRLYQFKKKASVLPVTLAELESEFAQNRNRYGEGSFSDLREHIRRVKAEENLRERLKHWFSVLDDKYHVQRFEQGLPNQ